MVAWMAVLFALTQAGHGLGANAADTLFFLRFGVEFLPLMILVSGPVLMLATLGYTVGLGRLGTTRWLTPLLATLAVMVVLERIGVSGQWPGIYAAVWLGAQTAILLSYTVMWNAAGEVCTTRQAKRLFPLFATAGIGGGIIGNALTGPLAGAIGTDNLLLVHAGLLGASAVVMTVGIRRFFWRSDPTPAIGILADLRAGFEITRATSLLRLLSWAAGAFSVLFFLVAFPFSAVVADSFRTEAEMAGYLGLFSAAATALTFLVSLVGVNRLFARIGVVATLLIVPAVYLAGFGLWLVSFSLLSASLVRGAQWVAVNALGGTAWSSLFNVVPGRRRSQVMAFISGIPTQLGTVASGGLLMVVATLTPDARNTIGLVVAAVVVVLVVKMRQAYTDALAEAVKQGMIDVFAAPVRGAQTPGLDADGLAVLVNALDDPQPGARILAARTLGRLQPDKAVEQLARALSDSDPGVRVAALESVTSDSMEVARKMLTDPTPRVRRAAIALLDRSRESVGPLADTVLRDPDPVVRSTAATLVDTEQGRPVIDEMLTSGDSSVLTAALSVLVRQPALSAILPESFAGHPDHRVRASAAKAMAGRLDNIGTLRQMLDDSSVRVRAAAAASLTSSPRSAATLIDVLATGSVRASEAALVAMTEAGLGADLFTSWIAAEVDRARFLRRHHLALGDETSSETRQYLRRLLLMRQHRLERWALLAFRVPQLDDAMPWVRRGVWSRDPDTRAYSLEALDSIHRKSPVRGLIALLEEAPSTDVGDVRTSLRELAHDHDEWIRALAVRCLIEDLYADFELIREAVENDVSDLVQSSLSRWPSTEMEQTQILSSIDRVLALQRVAMFSEIDPEDLERVASVTTERRYEANEVIYHEGDTGNEMLVIVTGEVEVRRGREPVIRTFGAGQHVGELALLRRGTRSADVIARADGVLGLALGASELEGILEERPEAAMAMLATLAERLGTMGESRNKSHAAP